MSATNRPRPGSREIAGGMRRSAVVAIASILLVAVGQFTALADPPADGEHPGNGAAVSEAASDNGQAHGNAYGHDDASTSTTSTTSTSDSTSDPSGSDEPVSGSGSGDAGGGTSTSSSAGSTAQPFSDPAHLSKITFCHATGSYRNPYVVITTAREAADSLAGNSGNRADHFGEHTGPIFDPATDSNGGGWGDVIPNVDNDGNAMPHNGMNWDAEGRALLANDCQVSAPVVQQEISVQIEKTNDANQDGIFTDLEEAKTENQDVTFRLVITNTGEETVSIIDLTDTFEQTTIDLLDAECASIAGAVLDPGDSVTCTFTLNGYSPPADTTLVDVARVCVEIVGGVETACDTNPSRVRSAIVLGRTVTPPPSAPPPRTESPPGGIAFTGPPAAVPLLLTALALLTLGTGLMWAGRRRSRTD